MPKPTREPAYERRYRNALERAADAIDKIVDSWDGSNVDALAQDIASQSLRIEPWARRTAADMLHGAAMALISCSSSPFATASASAALQRSRVTLGARRKVR